MTLTGTTAYASNMLSGYKPLPPVRSPCVPQCRPAHGRGVLVCICVFQLLGQLARVLPASQPTVVLRAVCLRGSAPGSVLTIMPQRWAPGGPDFQNKGGQFCPRKTCPTPRIAAGHRTAIRAHGKCHFQFLSPAPNASHANVKHA